MKNVLTSFALFLVCVLNAQQVIVDEKFDKDYGPIGYHFSPLSNKIFIEKGKHSVGMSRNKQVNSIISLDSKGSKTNLLENASVMNVRFSPTGNTFRTDEYEKMSFSGDHKFYKNGKKIAELPKSNTFSLMLDDFLFNNGNKIVGEDLNFTITELPSFKKISKKYELPSLDRIVNTNNVDYARDVVTSTRAFNDYFEIISKSISKDYKSTTLYRTRYNYDGKKISDIGYKIDIKNDFLIYSNNSGGNTETKGFGDTAKRIFSDDLSINNFKVDTSTNEVYVYGLYGKRAERSNDNSNTPLGYYVFKFKEDGTKIWEVINAIDDKGDFTDNQNMTYLYVDLFLMGESVVFSAGAKESLDDYIQYVKLNSNGKVDSSSKITFKSESNAYNITSYGDKKFLHANLTNKEDLKNKNLDYKTMVVYNTNQKVKDYIKTVNNKNKTSFCTAVNKGNTWLIESDNETYYKVTYFEN
jgi:hypothetical protein